LYTNTVTHFNGIIDSTDALKRDKVDYYYRKAHLEKTIDDINSAYTTAQGLVAYINTLSDASLSKKAKRYAQIYLCLTEAEKQLANGSITKAQFSVQIQSCQTVSGGINGKILDDPDDSYMLSNEQLQYKSIDNEIRSGLEKSERLITLMPNPTKNRINILSKETFGECQLLISDFNGKIVMKKTITMNQDEPISIDLELTNGVYFYTINNESIILDRNKLIILNQE
jgi:Secretion system C-terminal sorting domain